MRYFWSWIHAWATLFDGIFAVLSFGLWWPNVSFKFIAWNTTNSLMKGESSW